MNKPNKLNPATLAAHASGAFDEASGGIVPPIQTSTTYVRDRNYALHNPDNLYGRDHSEIVRTAEKVISNLEHAEQSLLFPSGMAAVAAVMRTVPNGGSIILQSGIYWVTTKWIRDFCERREITLKEVDSTEYEPLAQLIDQMKPQVVFIETPSNPWLKITDIKKVSAYCQKAGASLVVDSTAASPVLSQPLELGADIVLHSATKVINGHSDVLAGVLCCSDPAREIWQAIIADRRDAGAIIGNFEAWLLVRGMRTLPLRMERISANALDLAKFLDAHELVEKVYYPGLDHHPDHKLAVAQMSGGFGGLMSFLVRGDGQKALGFCGKLNIIQRATSLGGVESLVEHRHTIEGNQSNIPENLVRLSVGIEHIDDLKADIDQALR